MPTTPAGLVTPALTDAPNGPSQMLSLAASADPRVVGIFATAAARTAAYTGGTTPAAPSVGQVSYRQDAGVFEWYSGVAGGLWHPMPGGLMGTAAISAQATSSGTNGVTEALAGSVLTITGVVAGKNYRVSWGGWYRATVANTNAAAMIHASQSAITTASPTIGGCNKWIPQISWGEEDTNECLWTPGVSGTWNLQLGIKSTSGTGLSAIGPGQQNGFVSVYAT